MGVLKVASRPDARAISTVRPFLSLFSREETMTLPVVDLYVKCGFLTGIAVAGCSQIRSDRSNGSRISLKSGL
jgi:hypothetical protein